MSKYQIMKQRSNERDQQNARLKSHGFYWRKEQSYQEADEEIGGHWVLYGPDDQQISLSAALASIQQQEELHAKAIEGICKPCQKRDHCFCTKPDCRCACRANERGLA